MSDIEIRKFIVGPLETNCYVVVSEGKAMVVDPGYHGAQIAEKLSDVEVELIVATHGHFDHVGGVLALQKATGAEFAMPERDIYMAMNIDEDSWQYRVEADEDAPYPANPLQDGEIIGVGSATFKVIFTPGHTPGSACLLGGGSAEGIAFMGDTLFAGSAGRTDFVEGDQARLMESLERLKKEISPETQLLCGHGPETTMAQELATNPFLQ